jgi:hypothetical protein
MNCPKEHVAKAQKDLTPEDQKSRIETFQEKLNKVTSVYLIATSWWEQWCKYTGYGDEDKENAPKPGKIDNTNLQSTEFTLALNPGLTEEVHYRYLTPNSWKALHHWYPVVDDNSIFKREQTFDKRGKTRIELYPFIIDIKEYQEDGSIVHAKFEYFSADSTVETIFKRLQTDHPDVIVRLRVPFRIANFNGDEYLKENIPADFDKETYVELTRESSIWAVSLNSFNVLKRMGEVFIFEYESEKGTGKFPSSKVFDLKKLTVGSVAIGHDEYGKWYHMQIQGLKTNKKNKKEFLCHWLGFKKTWNEWIECDLENKYACIEGEEHKNVELKWYPEPSTKKKAARVYTNQSVVPISNRSRITGLSSTTNRRKYSKFNHPSVCPTKLIIKEKKRKVKREKIAKEAKKFQELKKKNMKKKRQQTKNEACPKHVFVVVKIQTWKVRTNQYNHRICHKKRHQTMGPVYKTLEQAEANVDKRIQSIKYNEQGEVTPTPHTWEQITTFKIKKLRLE